MSAAPNVTYMRCHRVERALEADQNIRQMLGPKEHTIYRPPNNTAVSFCAEVIAVAHIIKEKNLEINRLNQRQIIAIAMPIIYRDEGTPLPKFVPEDAPVSPKAAVKAKSKPPQKPKVKPVPKPAPKAAVKPVNKPVSKPVPTPKPAPKPPVKAKPATVKRAAKPAPKPAEPAAEPASEPEPVAEPVTELETKVVPEPVRPTPAPVPAPMPQQKRCEAPQAEIGQSREEVAKLFKEPPATPSIADDADLKLPAEGKLAYVWGVSVNTLQMTCLTILEANKMKDSPFYKRIEALIDEVAKVTVLPRPTHAKENTNNRGGSSNNSSGRSVAA